MVWTDQDEAEFELGKWHVFFPANALEETPKLDPVVGQKDIWPHWNDGAPTLMRQTLYTEAFFNKGVRHYSRQVTQTVQLEWSAAQPILSLASNRRRLPSIQQRYWTGVYRVFSTEKPVPRCCGVDQTGTLYIGKAGTGKKRWSILRTRLSELAKRNHHVAQKWGNALREHYPFASLAVQWARTPEILNYLGENIPGADQAESWLLSCYCDSFGELPPLNERR